MLLWKSSSSYSFSIRTQCYSSDGHYSLFQTAAANYVTGQSATQYSELQVMLCGRTVAAQPSGTGVILALTSQWILKMILNL